jgi:GT2 family glycosyltransferase
VVIFDDDLELPTNCLESFLRIHSEGWDVVTGTVCEEGAPLVSDRKGTRPFWNLLQHRHGESRGHTIAVSSGFVSIRTSVIRELGYLDEAFIYNYDDYDLGFRLWKAGATIIHDPRVCATHLKSITGGSREDLTGRKRVLNKYTAKYYFLSKHFLRRAVVIEYLTDILTTITDYGIRVGKVASKVLILTLAFRAARSYSCHTTQDASSVTEAPANGFVGNFEA